MSSNFYSVGLNHVGAYQVSGFPYVYGGQDCTTATSFEFPYVTRWVKIHNAGTTECKIGFSETGVAASNYLTLPAGESTDTLEVKTNVLWIVGSSNVDIMAGLTNIPASRMGELTGVGIDA